MQFRFSRSTSFLSLLFLSVTSIYSQVFQPSDYRKDLSIKLSVIDEKRIEKGVKTLNEAYFEERKALSELESLKEDERLDATSSEYKKVVKDLIKSSEIYREGHLLIYTVFQENCVKFGEEMKKMNHTASGVNKARFYERKGEKAFDRALNFRDLILMLEKPELIQYKMAESLELERLSIRDRGRAVQIYQDFPVEYDYNWEDDVTDEEVRAAFKDPAVTLPPDDLFTQKPVQKTSKNEEPLPEIVFCVQIAAHTIKMDEGYLRENIYNGPLRITESHEGGWYKYLIGNFNNFRDASDLLKKIGVSRAFVVAYENGNRLSIKDALAKIKEAQ